MQDRFLIARGEFAKVTSYVSGLTGVAEDGIAKGNGRAIVHQAGAEAQAPQGRGAYAVLGLLKVIRRTFAGHLASGASIVFDGRDDDAVAGADVMQEEVAEGMKGLAAERGGDGEGAAIDLDAGGRR